MPARKRMRIASGPVLFNWAPEQWRDFHFRLADVEDVDIVHVGEVVCAKRHPFFEPYMAEVVERLLASGKQVVLSALALAMNRNERSLIDSITAMAGEASASDETADEGGEGEGALIIEANDLTALARLAGRRFVIGPFVNTYNALTVKELAHLGAVRICLPPELGRQALSALVPAMTDIGVEAEVFAFGRMPLALSARCYHARSHGLPKDGCRYVCGEDPDGLPLKTLDEEPFLAVNGIQTLSYACLNLLGEIPLLKDMGVSVLRLSPHAACDMAEVAAIFRAVADENMAVAEGLARLEALKLPFPFANGYFHGQPGAAWLKPDPA